MGVKDGVSNFKITEGIMLLGGRESNSICMSRMLGRLAFSQYSSRGTSKNIRLHVKDGFNMAR